MVILKCLLAFSLRFQMLPPSAYVTEPIAAKIEELRSCEGILF
jgi:hypothetical protein